MPSGTPQSPNDTCSLATRSVSRYFPELMPMALFTCHLHGANIYCAQAYTEACLQHRWSHYECIVQRLQFVAFRTDTRLVNKHSNNNFCHATTLLRWTCRTSNNPTFQIFCCCFFGFQTPGSLLPGFKIIIIIIISF